MVRMHRKDLKVIETPPDRAVTRLHQLVRQREALRQDFHTTWEQLAASSSEHDLEVWSAGILALANVNAGPASLLAFWRMSLERAAALGLPALAAMAEAFADVCRHAGAAPALACIEATGIAAHRLRERRQLLQWSRGLVRLALEAPESVVAVTSRAETILQFCNGDAFESFVGAGLKLAGGNRARRRAFFTLEDPRARRILERETGGIAFSDIERPLKLFATALWGRPSVLRSFAPENGQTLPHRASIAGGIVRVPPTFRGVPEPVVPQLFRACVAHATAHLALTPERFSIGSLKPLQMTLIGLIEDARVEALAMKRFPGLWALWKLFHVAAPTGVVTAPALFARLARALFDPDYIDGDGFIAKARALFAAETGRLEDASLSRRIGGLLGNDVGQMRLQFDARTHVIEPIYRDDGLGLWDFGDQPPPETDATELIVDTVRMSQSQERTSSRTRNGDATQDPAAAGRARPAAPDERGIMVARYPEWDRTAGVERPEWTTVREVVPALGSHRDLSDAIERASPVLARVGRLVRSARIGRYERLKRRHEGSDLDLDAALEAAIAQRVGEPPDERVYRTMARRTRDLSVLMLLDISESTRDRVGGLGSVLDIQRLAVTILGQTLSALGDPFALRAFASAGRDDVRLVRIKDFDEAFGPPALARLAGLTPGLSTRLGAALRHAGAEIAPLRTHRKLVLVLSDGEPSDIDVNDSGDLVEDARRATHALKHRGVDVFGVTLDPSGVGSGTAVFGRNQHMPVRRLEDLPSRLSELYFRLARR